MFKPPSRTRRRLVAGLAASFLVGTVLAAAAAAQPVASARIWFYRDYEPYVNRNYATVMLNGVVAGSVQPYGGSLARDVAPGHYHASVESFGTDVNQNVDFDLAPGQEAFIKILNSPGWVSGGDMYSFERDTYSLRMMPPETARAEMARRSF